MLGGMALKRRWQHARRAAGMSTDRPNIVMGINVQVCWEKFANFLRSSRGGADGRGPAAPGAAEAAARWTRTPSVWSRSSGPRSMAATSRSREICTALDDFEESTGSTSPSMSTGRPGAMIAPFWTPTWRGTSGCHGWRRSTPPATSTGWCTRASAGRCGATAPRCPTISCSRSTISAGRCPPSRSTSPGRGQVIAQYYNFLRLGREGYRRVQQGCRDVATTLSAQIARLGPFRLLTDEITAAGVRLRARP